MPLPNMTNKSKISTTQRIETLLAGNSISDSARKYLLGLIKAHGSPELVAASTRFGAFGLSVFENKAGERALIYGDYSRGHTPVDALYCGIDSVLDAMEDGDGIPDWWDDQCTVVEVPSNNAYGYDDVTKDYRGNCRIDLSQGREE